MSSFLLDVLACRIPASRYWVTLLFLRFSYLLDDYLDSSGWDESVKDLCQIMITLTVFFCWVTTVFFSDPVLLMESVDSLCCLLGPIEIEVGGCSVMVSSQLMNNSSFILFGTWI